MSTYQPSTAEYVQAMRDAAAWRAERATTDQCECGHHCSGHRRGGGRCTGLDSYGIACACPSFVPWSDSDDET